MKFLSLIKACFSQDMNMFKYSFSKKSSFLKKLLVPIILFLLVSFSIGTYSFMIASSLAPLNLTHVVLSMFIIGVTVLSFSEGIYKSQGILFDAKDDDLLFSLPIKKWQILLVRMLKLLVFQYIFNLMFLLPAFVSYIYFEHPGFVFYFVSILLTFLVPLLPITFSCIIGYMIKLMSLKFKAKKLIQTIFSSIVFLGIFFFSFFADGFISNIISNASTINDVLIKIYYPVGLYVKLIFDFNLLDLVKLLLFNIISFAVFMFCASKLYFKVVFKSKDNVVVSTKNGKENVVVNKPIVSLIKKEIRRYFSSPIYIFNSSFGLLLGVTLSFFVLFKGFDAVKELLPLVKFMNIPLAAFIFFFILFIGCVTHISASSISLEGKTINITKSLPISFDKIVKSKILTCFILELPFLILISLIFIIRLKFDLSYGFLIILLCFAVTFLVSCMGLIVNLKYPKMDAQSDTEVVKQSMSVFISTILGFGIFIGSLLLVIYLRKVMDILIVLYFLLALLFIIAIFLYVFLIKREEKLYRKINI